MLLNQLKKDLIKDDKITEEKLYAMKLVSQLIKIRKDKKITQKELAEKSGVTQSTISRFENFEIMPQLETVIRLSTALNAKILVSFDSNVTSNEGENQAITN